jgi:chaperone modulatory protein CbpM
METEVITITEYCIRYQADVSFIDALEQNGLVSVIVINEERCIGYDQLSQLEHYSRLYYDLDINIEGIDVVHHLLEKVKSMQDYIHSLETRLSRYEQISGRGVKAG